MIDRECLNKLEQLRWYREEQKISTEELAKMSGVPKEYIEGYEKNNYSYATLETVEKIVKALGLEFIFASSDI